jgi:hypothetical protein
MKGATDMALMDGAAKTAQLTFNLGAHNRPDYGSVMPSYTERVHTVKIDV